MTVVNTPSTFSKETLLKQGPILEVVIGYKIEQLDPSNSLYALIDTGADDPVIGKSFASSLGLPVIRECEVTGVTGKDGGDNLSWTDLCAFFRRWNVSPNYRIWIYN